MDTTAAPRSTSTDVRTRRELGRPLAGHTGIVVAVALSVQGTLASAGQDGSVRLWEPGDRGATMRGHAGAVSSIAYAPGGKALASGGR